jgi:hypothetical protein
MLYWSGTSGDGGGNNAVVVRAIRTVTATVSGIAQSESSSMAVVSTGLSYAHCDTGNVPIANGQAQSSPKVHCLSIARIALAAIVTASGNGRRTAVSIAPFAAGWQACNGSWTKWSTLKQRTG